MTPTPITAPQTLILLALSRGERLAYLPPITRRALLAKQWMSRDGKVFTITDAGLRALAESPHLAEAQRKLDAGKQSRPWQT